MLPTDTDFYGITDQLYRGTAISGELGDTRLLPLARSGGVPTVDVVVCGTESAELDTTRKTALHLAREWSRQGIVCRAKTAEAVSPSRDLKEGSDDTQPLERIDFERIAERADLAHPESYTLHFAGGVATVSAATHAGLERGAATLSQCLRPGDGESLHIAAMSLSDRPAIDIRFLGGWALWRTDQLREAIDLAWAFKANRVLYNGWGWIPGEQLWKEDSFYVSYARERGIELVYELRRMSFGKEYDIRDPAARQKIVEAYEKAAEHGFRSFGLLFDDVPWETAADECALVEEVVRRLQQHARKDVEFFCCPQFYWYPGQMNAAWSGHGDDDETAKQRAYLETYGRLLPEEIHVYIANFWGGHPREYQYGLREKFSELVGRKPIFFDNQQINDYRLGALLPFPLAGRPPDFGDHVQGYYLNCARPLAVHAPAAATTLAFAWNPEAYQPEIAMQQALAWYFGPSRERVRLVSEGLNRMCALANEWAGGTTTAVDHYRTIWRQVQDGKVDSRTVERWKEEVRTLRGRWLGALEIADAASRQESRSGLLALVDGTYRFEHDLEIFAGYLRAKRDPSLTTRFAVESQRLAQHALDHVASLLPPAPGTGALLARLDEENTSALEPRDAQGWSWVEYFYRRTLETLRQVRGEMLEELGQHRRKDRKRTTDFTD